MVTFSGWIRQSPISQRALQPLWQPVVVRLPPVGLQQFQLAVQRLHSTQRPRNTTIGRAHCNFP